MTGNFEIIPLSPDEHTPMVVAFHYKIFSTTEKGFVGGVKARNVWRAELSPPNRGIGIVQGSQIVAMAVLAVIEPGQDIRGLSSCYETPIYLEGYRTKRFGVVHSVFVDTGCRGQGCMGEMLEYNETIARNDGLESLFTEINQNNAPSIYGFKKQKYTEAWIGVDPSDRTLSSFYWKALSPSAPIPAPTRVGPPAGGGSSVWQPSGSRLVRGPMFAPA